MQFDYQDPSPKFDRTKVKGPVAKLVRVKDMSTATALEVTAGSKVTSAIHVYYIGTLYSCHSVKQPPHYYSHLVSLVIQLHRLASL